MKRRDSSRQFPRRDKSRRFINALLIQSDSISANMLTMPSLIQKDNSIGRKVASFTSLMVLALVCIGCANPPVTNNPISIEPIVRDGPVRGFVARIDLTDPRVVVRVVPASPNDPDGDGPCVTSLDEVESIAARNKLELAVNASFFNAPASREVMGKDVHYFKGNPAYPVAWLVSDSRRIHGHVKSSSPSPSLVVYKDNRVEIVSSFYGSNEVREAVSGSELLVEYAQIVASDNPLLHPRTAVGLNAERTELMLVVIDGRRENWSRGVTLKELAQIMYDLGAHYALNLDGGGSSTMVERVSGNNYRIVNRPSDGTEVNASLSIPRAVCDAIGVRILPTKIR